MNFLTSTTNPRYLRLAYVVFALIMAILYDLLFWKQELGVNFLLWVALYIVGFLVLTHFTGHFAQPRALLLLIPILVMSVDVLLYNNYLVQLIVPFVALIFLVLFSILLTLRNPHRHAFSFLRIPLLRNLETYFLEWPDFFRDVFRWGRPQRQGLYKKIAWGVVLAIPILLILGSLLAMADSAFNNLLRELFDWNIKITTLWRILRTGVFTLLLACLLYVLIGEKHSLDEGTKFSIALDGVVVGTILALVNALFLMFVVLQLRTINVADEARSGFFQLAWVVALSAFMLFLFYTSKTSDRGRAFLTFLKVLLVAQVGIIAYSAVRRMNLFQDLGYSVLRLYVEWFIYFVMIILAIAAVSLLVRWPFKRLFYSTLVIGTVAFAIVASINVDRMVAEENVSRLISKHKASSIEYLQALSLDAGIPIAKYMKSLPADLRDDLFQLLDNYSNEVRQHDSWREWNLGIAKIKEHPDEYAGYSFSL